jgi:hypothetical protein
METAKNFVGGSLVDARVREEIDVPDPATGELLGRSPVAVNDSHVLIHTDPEKLLRYSKNRSSERTMRGG